MIESTKHDAIYLQLCDDEDSEWCDTVTWCQERVHKSDVKYIRADLVESLLQQLAEALAAIKMKDDALQKCGTDLSLTYKQIMDICKQALAATEPSP